MKYAAILVSTIAILCAIGVGVFTFSKLVNEWPDDGIFTNSHGVSGDFIGGHIAAAGSLIGTLLFISALTMQMLELRKQREDIEQARSLTAEQVRVAELNAHLASAQAIGMVRTTLLQRASEIAELGAGHGQARDFVKSQFSALDQASDTLVSRVHLQPDKDLVASISMRHIVSPLD